MTMRNAPSNLDYQNSLAYDEPQLAEPEELDEPPKWADANIPEPNDRDYYEELKGDMDYDLMVEDQILAEEREVA